MTLIKKKNVKFWKPAHINDKLVSEIFFTNFELKSHQKRAKYKRASSICDHLTSSKEKFSFSSYDNKTMSQVIYRSTDALPLIKLSGNRINKSK